MNQQTAMLRKKLRIHDPYAGIDLDEHPADMQGWNSDHRNFSDMMEKYQPKVIVEVGSWKGASAIHMARLIKEKGYDTAVVCCDTWLGSIEHRSGQHEHSLRTASGRPRLFETFRANVVRNEATDIITPLALPSTIAADFFKQIQVEPELVFIDGSHEADDVYCDVNSWFPVTKVGGAVFGDDYGHPYVQRALKAWAKVNDQHLEALSCEIQWVIHKQDALRCVPLMDIIEKYN